MAITGTALLGFLSRLHPQVNHMERPPSQSVHALPMETIGIAHLVCLNRHRLPPRHTQAALKSKKHAVLMEITGTARQVYRSQLLLQAREVMAMAVMVMRLLVNALPMGIIGTVRKASKNLPILRLRRKRVDSQLSLPRLLQENALPTGITGIVPKAFGSHHTHQLESRARLSRL